MTSDEAAEIVRDWSELLLELRDHIDKSQFDLSALLGMCEYDARKIISFVGTQISFEQYAGVLRGAAGTLSSRAGNSLDQSLLLATLLKDAGYEAEILRARLGPTQTNELLAQLAVKVDSEPVVFSPSSEPVLAKLRDLAESIQQVVGFEPEPIEDSPAFSMPSARNEATLHYQFLRRELEQFGVPLRNTPVPKDIVDEAADYFWVHFREGSSGPWRPVHPSFGKPPSFAETLQPTETLVDEIPPELHQSISLQAFAKRRIGQRVETVPLMHPWKRPVALLIDHPVSYSNGFTAEVEWPSEGPLGSSTLFIPMLGNNAAPGAIAFNLKGDTAPAAEAFSPMSGIFRQVGDKTRNAADALSQMGSSKSAESSPEAIMAMEEVWLEIVHTGPGTESPRSWKRFFRSAAGRPPTPAQVAQRITFNFETGSVAPAKLIDRFLLQHATTLQLALLQHGAAKGDTPPDPALLLKQLAIYDEQVLFKMMINLSSPDQDASRFSYRHEPLIVAKHKPLFLEHGMRSGLDIISNARRSFQTGPEAVVEFAPSISLFEGVWETLCEALVMKFEEDEVFGTIRAFEPAVRNNSKARILTRAADVNRVSGLEEDAHALILKSVQDQQVIVLPLNQAEGTDFVAWWQVDPKTGESLGVAENGWGTALVEYKGPDQVTALANCVIATLLSCQIIAKFVRAELGVLFATGYDWAVMSLIFAILGGGDPGPDPWTPSEDEFAGWPLKRILDYLEARVFSYCVEAMFPHCVLHFVP